MNLGETDEERELLDRLIPMVDQARDHLNHVTQHFQVGEYADITSHMATLCAGLLTFSEEFVIVCMTDDDMSELIKDGIKHAEGSQFGRMILLRQWWEGKREDAEEREQSKRAHPSNGELG